MFHCTCGPRVDDPLILQWTRALLPFDRCENCFSECDCIHISRMAAFSSFGHMLRVEGLCHVVTLLSLL